MNKLSTSIDPSGLSSTELQCFWALDHLETDQRNRFSTSEVRECIVEVAGISVTKDQIRMALTRAADKVNFNSSGYRLMEKGRKALAGAHAEEIFFVESGKPFTAKRVHLAKIFSSMRGHLRVCDPYVDAQTLHAIFTHVGKKNSVKILTQRVMDKPKGAVKALLNELKGEGYSVEIKQYTASGIHDRYILDNDQMWLSGNSFNHLGEKESFIVKVGEDTAQSMRALFDSRWKSASAYN